MRPPPGCGPLPSNGMPRSKIAPRLTSWAAAATRSGVIRLTVPRLVVVAPAAPVADPLADLAEVLDHDVSSLARRRDTSGAPAAAVTSRQDPLPWQLVL